MTMWWRWIIALLIVIVLAVGVNSIVYANYVGRRSEDQGRQNIQNFCTLMIVLDDAYQAATPTTEVGKKVRDAVHTLRIQLGCPASPAPAHS